MVYLGKTENVQIPLKASVQNSMQNLFAKIVQSAFVIGFTKSYKILKSNDWE